jgi:hypothetical protein
MNTNTPLLRFVKDGLVGVAVVLILFVIVLMMPGVWLALYRFPEFTVAHLKDFLTGMFFFMNTNGIDIYAPGPMTIVILTAFISVGIGGRFFETIATSRKDWIIRILRILGVSILVGVGLSAIGWGLLLSGSMNKFSDGFLLIVETSTVSTVAGGLGAIIGLVIGVLSGILFHLQKRSSRLAAGAISSALVSYGVGFGILLVVMISFFSS